MKIAKIMATIFFVFVATILYSYSTLAVGATIQNVYMDGAIIHDTDVNGITGVERGDSVTIKVETRAYEPVSDAQVEVQITGVHNEDVSAITDTFDMKANVTYFKSLKIQIPGNTDTDRYRLRVRVTDRSGATEENDYMFQLDAKNYLVLIRDVTYTPENEVKAGRSLLAQVRVKNMGYRDEQGVKIKMEIPELGVSATDIIDQLDVDETTTSNELYLRIPQCAKEGDYDINIIVYYDDLSSQVKQADTIHVVKDDSVCSGTTITDDDTNTVSKTSVVVPQSRDIIKGTGGTAYPITITNAASTSQTFTLSLTGVDTWGTYTFEPSNVIVVPSKGTSTTFLYIAANNNAVVGQSTFALGVTTNAGAETIPLQANVKEGAGTATNSDSLRKGLEIALIVLVILLVILGLAIAFTKMRDAEQKPPKKEEVIITEEQKPVYY